MTRPNAILLAGLALVLMLAVAPIKLAYATEVKSVKSPLGMTAWLVEDHTNPVISMSFAFKGAAALDPVGKAGLANLVSALLDEGAGDLDSQAFQRRLEDGAITLRFSAGKDNFSGNFRTLTENMDEATELLRLAVTSARFDVEPVERIRAQVMANVRRELEDADTIASDAL
ncbi:MAG: insulinase family protein, partial [Rhodospirillaceae bacterium]|nr:insulinase family protein [Rhodospirillaceae bacterium]